jgi:replicative DNA helicase
MTDSTLIDQYIPDGHHPHALPLSKIYGKAAEELLKPYPAVHLRNFPKFNHMTGGFRPHEYSIFCGQTGSGKTTILANFSKDLNEQHIPHFVASVETGETDYVKRIISATAGEDWNTGDAVEIAKLKTFHVQHGDKFQRDQLHLSLYDNRISVETLMADIAWMVKHNGVKVVIIDNLNFLLEVTKAADQVMEMDRVTHELIMFCKKVPVHIIMVMHPRKTEAGRIESVDSIKGSSTANQEAYNIFFWNRPHPDLIKDGVAVPEDRELLIAKMRRKGKFVMKRLIFKTSDGVLYREGDIAWI